MHNKLLIRQFPMHIQKTSHVTVTWLLHCSKSFYLLYLLKLYRNCSASYLKSWMIKMIRKEKKTHQNSELLSFYTHREIVYTCLNKLGIETCWDTIRLHGGYSNVWNVLTKMSQSFWCIFSLIAIIFFFKSSQVLQLIPLLRADLEAREYLVLYNVVMCISPLGAPHLYKALTPGVINVLNHATRV